MLPTSPQAGGEHTWGGGSCDRRARSKLSNRKKRVRPGQEHGRENAEKGGQGGVGNGLESIGEERVSFLSSPSHLLGWLPRRR